MGPPMTQQPAVNLEPCLDGLIEHLRGDLPHSLVKAQLAQESAFNPFAVSPTGPVGLAQFTKITWAEVMPNVPEEKRIDIYLSILAQCKYMTRLMQWAATLAQPADVAAYALAAYNAGQGTVRKCAVLASQRGKHPYEWDAVHDCLPTIVGPFKAQETQQYVERILAKVAEYEKG